MTPHAEPAPGLFRIPAVALHPDAARTRHVLSIPDLSPGDAFALARVRPRHVMLSAMAEMEWRGAGVVDAEISSPS